MNSHKPMIYISISEQRMQLLDGDKVWAEFPVSTALNGVGEQNGSGCTPRGWHIIRAKIGGDATYGTVFRSRRPTGESYSAELGAAHPERDWILSRILWLSGCERGINRLGNVDSMRRYIYIHGCPDSSPMGTPLSHGCVRMRNADVIELFDRVEPGTRVFIAEREMPMVRA